MIRLYEVGMHSILDILIKKQEFEKIDIEECFIYWDGELLSYEPGKYNYHSSLFFHENIDMNYYENFIHDGFNVFDAVSLTLEGNQLEELSKSVNNEENNIYTNELVLFIDELGKILNEFCIVKLRDEEYADEIYVIKKASEAIDILVESLQRDCPRGVAIIVKK